MRERPILFSSAMVRAILDGRKTQTRRVIAGLRDYQQKHAELESMGERDGRTTARFRTPWARVVEAMGWDPPPPVAWEHEHSGKACPFGVAGDRLWVREAHGMLAAPSMADGVIVAYRASCDGDELDYVDPRDGTISRVRMHRWRPSIHMPRWASRLHLEMTEVRVERLQSITREDARAEGPPIGVKMPGVLTRDGVSEPADVVIFDPVRAFAVLWDSINGKRPDCSWADNPWVWVVGFKRVEEGL